MLRYTLLRLMIFFGCLLVLWLAGLRSPDQQVLLLLGAAAASVVLSYLLLRRQRDEFAARLAARIERRAELRRRASGLDEEAEDAELEDAEFKGAELKGAEFKGAELKDGARPHDR